MGFDKKIEFDPSTGEIVAKNEKADSFVNKIILSLRFKKGTKINNLNIGSKIHLINKVTPTQENLLKKYCKEAVAWLINRGEASSIDFNIYPLNKNGEYGYYIEVIAIKKDGKEFTFDLFHKIA